MVPSVQVASAPFTHEACPGIQVFVHDVEQTAEGELPAQLMGGVQGEVDATYRQPLASFAQVATVWPSWHTVPTSAQIEAGQVHAAVVPATTHSWFGPHVVVVAHAVHPLGCSRHVCTAPDKHCVAPAVHGFSHVVPAPSASPLVASEPGALPPSGTVALAASEPLGVEDTSALPPSVPGARVAFASSLIESS